MEGSSSLQINPIRAYYRQKNSGFVSAFTLRVSGRVSWKSIGMIRNPKPVKSVFASIQPIEASQKTSFDNALPSKGNLRIQVFIFHK